MEMSSKNPKFVVLGGGTGSFTLLSSLKNYVQDLTALVSMADDGGSTGMLRDQYGVLPPGDVRQCLVALSSSPHLRELFNFRFPGDGSLGGHTFGNLFLSALEMLSEDFGESIKIASEVLRIQGKVLPISLDDCRLIYRDQTGNNVKGEHEIENTDISADSRPEISYEKPVKLNSEAKKVLEEADMVVIAPGSLYTSLIPLLLVEGMPELLQKVDAKIVYVANLVNKPMETKDYSVGDYVREIERFAETGVIDAVLYNTDHPNEDTLGLYAKEGEYPVIVDDQTLNDASYEAIPGKFLSRKAPILSPSDPLFAERSLIRHDADVVSRALMKIYYS